MKSFHILVFIGFTAFGWLIGQHWVKKPHLDNVIAPESPKTAPSALSNDIWRSFRAETASEFLRLREEIRSREDLSPGRRLVAEATLVENLSDAAWEQLIQIEETIELPYLELRSFLKRRAEKDPTGTMAILEHWKAKGRDLRHMLNYEQAVYQAWVKQDAAAATEHALHETQTGQDRWAFHYFIESWAWQDPKSAVLAYARLAADKNIGQDHPESTLQQAFLRWFDRDKVTATHWARHEAPERFRKVLQQNLPQENKTRKPEQDSFSSNYYRFTEDLATNPSAAAQQLNDESFRKAMGGVEMLTYNLEFRLIYDKNVEGKLTQITEALHEHPAFADDLLSGFVKYRQERDFPQAAAIAKGIKDETKRKACYVKLTSQNLAKSPERVSEWLKQLPTDDPARHEAVAWMVKQLSPSDPASAKAWRDTLPAGYR